MGHYSVSKGQQQFQSVLFSLTYNGLESPEVQAVAETLSILIKYSGLCVCWLSSQASVGEGEIRLVFNKSAFGR